MSKGKFLAEFELFVMLALARLGNDAYGVSIRREIESRTDRPVSIGAVYATLGRLSDKGLVIHSISLPLPVPGGRSRKYFQLSKQGRRALAHSAGMLTQMMDGIDMEAWSME